MKCIDLLNSSDIGEVLSREEKDAIVSNNTFITYSKGDCIVRKGEYVTNAIFICCGYVKFHLEFKLKNIIFDLLGPKKFILLSQMVTQDIQPFNITAIEETTVCLIDINLFRQFARQNSRLSYYLLQRTNNGILSYVGHNLVSLTQNNIHGRLANAIVYLAETVFKSSSFDMMLSRKELSEFCNISRENVIKVLYEFDKDGLIHLSGKNIHIISIDGLKKIANH